MKRSKGSQVVAGLAFLTLCLFAGASYAESKNALPDRYLYKDDNHTDPFDKEYRLDPREREVTVFYDECKVKELVFTETKRQSRLEQDIRKVIGKFAPGSSDPNADDKCVEKKVSKTYRAKYGRSTLIVRAKGDKGETLEESTIVIGPEEHLFLSIDLPVTHTSELKFDATTNSLQPRGADSQFYLGVNYLFGDLLSVNESETEPKVSSNDLHIKLMLKASSRPLDSLGIGLGWKLPDLGSFANLRSLSLFFGHFWTKEDSLDGGVVRERSHYSGSWRVGVSFNLDEGLKYVK